MTPIYLDHHATTPVDPRVLSVVARAMAELYGNPGSVTHVVGHAARDAVESARAEMARLLGVPSSDLIFTSGATESNNLVIRGVLEHPRCRGAHVVSLMTEHRAVLDPLRRQARRGVEVTLLAPKPQGRHDAGVIDLDPFISALRPETALVSIMWANNEIGVLQPIAEIARICREREVLLHCDATQAVGKVPLGLDTVPVDFLSFTAHKMYGPKGVGGLVVNRRNPRTRLLPQIEGGGQESGLRSGTLNVPGILGFAAALSLACDEMPLESSRLRRLRDLLFTGLSQSLEGVVLNGPGLEDPTLRLAGNLNVSFPGVAAQTLMLGIPELCVTTGSRCSSATPEPSHVLTALGCDADHVRSSLRFGVGRFNTPHEMDRATELLVTTVKHLRKCSHHAPA